MKYDIEVLETVVHGRRVLTIVDVSGPPPTPIANEQLLGIGARLHRLYGGEWLGDFETGGVKNV